MKKAKKMTITTFELQELAQISHYAYKKLLHTEESPTPEELYVIYYHYLKVKYGINYIKIKEDENHMGIIRNMRKKFDEQKADRIAQKALLDMQGFIDELYSNNDPKTIAFRNLEFPNGKPSVEEFVMKTVDYLNEKAEEEEKNKASKGYLTPPENKNSK